jgi:hypothetical protein
MVSTHLHLVWRLRAHRALPPVPLYTLMSLYLDISAFFLTFILWQCTLVFDFHDIYFILLKYFRFSGHLQFYWCLGQRNWQDPVSGSDPSSTKSCVISACNSSSHYYLNASHYGSVIGTFFKPGQCTICHIEAHSMGSYLPAYITVMSDTSMKPVEVSLENRLKTKFVNNT